MIERTDSETRLAYLLRVAIVYLRDNAEGTVEYDGTTCDGWCLADDLQTELDTLQDIEAQAQPYRILQIGEDVKRSEGDQFSPNGVQWEPVGCMPFTVDAATLGHYRRPIPLPPPVKEPKLPEPGKYQLENWNPTVGQWIYVSTWENAGPAWASLGLDNIGYRVRDYTGKVILHNGGPVS